ncbi:MAG: coenzyme A pyrophosphatase [Methanobacteriota archaeon]|nr:MAG: coenzyme A pyrophosphatase [Euryarchaeota archaeon]
MAPGNRAFPPDMAGYRDAAVLLALFPRDGAWRLPLIVRTDDGGIHAGQVALPGGALESGESPEAGALRETQEETGLAPADAELLGRLSPLPIPASRFRVTPVVATLAGEPAWRLDGREVASLFSIPLAALRDGALRCSEQREFGGEPIAIPYFALGDEKVWGATAMVLAELAALLE